MKNLNLNIKNSGVLKILKSVLRWGLPAIAIIAAAGYGYKIKKMYSTESPVIYQKGIDNSLFNAGQQPPAEPKDVEKPKFNFKAVKDFLKVAADKKPAKPKAKKKSSKKRRKAGPVKAKIKKPAARSKAVQPSDPRPSPPKKVILFPGAAVKKSAFDPVDEFNERRRRGGIITASSNLPDTHTAGTLPYPKKKRWPGVQQETASYPTDMTRVALEGAFIHAILKEAINSELGGIVRATVQRNIYGAEGRLVLIPSGSKVIGRYKPVEHAGQERIMIFWHRIVTPDGININTVDAETTDQMGRSGVTGKINRKYLKRYGMTFMISLLSAVASLNVNVANEFQADVVTGFSKNLLDLTKEILSENMKNHKPTISIPAGSKIIVRVIRDIYFREPENNAVQIVSAG